MTSVASEVTQEVPRADTVPCSLTAVVSSVLLAASRKMVMKQIEHDLQEAEGQVTVVSFQTGPSCFDLAKRRLRTLTSL